MSREQLRALFDAKEAARAEYDRLFEASTREPDPDRRFDLTVAKDAAYDRARDASNEYETASRQYRQAAA